MIVFLLNVYLVLLFLMVHFRVVRFNLFWKASPVLVLLLLLVGLFVPMGWGAPSGPVIVGRNSVQIVPNVSGTVVELAAQPNTPLKAGDLLFRIDPAPFRFKVDDLQAQLVAAQQQAEQLKAAVDAATASLAAVTAQVDFATQRRDDIAQLARRDASSQFRLEDEEKQVATLSAQQNAARAQLASAQLALRSQINGVNTGVARLTAQLGDAQWQLNQTEVRAPAAGYVTNVGLRKGDRVSNLSMAPVMAFIEQTDVLVAAEIAQIDARYLTAGQPVEMTFKVQPGRIYSGTVETVLQALASGQVAPSGRAVATGGIAAEPFVVRIKLDDAAAAQALPAGSTGTAAIYTDRVKPAHVIRKVLLRQQAILNYVLPF
jgi:multidrug resistance efflux pump